MDYIRAAFVAAILGCVMVGCSSDRSASTSTEATEAACSDGEDNDGDGLQDCAEPSCSTFAFCGGPGDAGMTDAGPEGPTAVCATKVDLVFVVDISTSMENEIEAIDAGLERLWTAAEEAVGDVQASLVMFKDEELVAQDCTPFSEPQALRDELTRWWRCLSGDVGDGGEVPDEGSTSLDCSGIPSTSNGDCPENSLDALARAAGCPLRPDALRLAIHVTDDTFVEHPGQLTGMTVEHTYDETVTALQESELRVGAFAIPGIGEYCGVGSSPNVGRGFHEPFEGKEAIPSATGGQVWDLREVRAGSLDMAVAIDTFVRKESCELY